MFGALSMLVGVLVGVGSFTGAPVVSLVQPASRTSADAAQASTAEAAGRGAGVRRVVTFVLLGVLRCLWVLQVERTPDDGVLHPW